MGTDPHGEPVASLLTRVGLHAAGWAVSDLAHNRWLTPGIWQLTNGSERIVLKWLRADRPTGETAYERHWTARSAEPRRWNYWAREALAYRDRIVEYFDTSLLGAPRCVGLDITDDDAVLALAFVEGEPGERFTVRGYAEVGYAVGRSQAPYLCGRGLPQHQWMSSQFLREYTEEKPVDYSLLVSDDAWNQPLVRECFPAELRPVVVELHRRADDLHQVMESLPRTLCQEPDPHTRRQDHVAGLGFCWLRCHW
jgi:hypothetical protein